MKTILGALGWAGMLALCGLVFTGNASASERISDTDRFRLWNNCEPIGMVVRSRFKGFGDPKERFEGIIRDKLQAANVYDKNTPNAFMQLDIAVVDLHNKGKMFSFVFLFFKTVDDKKSGLRYLAATTHIHSGPKFVNPNSTELIFSQLNNYLDLFVEEYLRVNADAC